MLKITNRQADAMARALPGTQMVMPCRDTATWIGIELLDADDQPVPGERYVIRLPDASRMEGRLDDAGRARVEGIVPGTCEVAFPDIDAREWFAA